jgi:hypothetical protein
LMSLPGMRGMAALLLPLLLLLLLVTDRLDYRLGGASYWWHGSVGCAADVAADVNCAEVWVMQTE